MPVSRLIGSISYICCDFTFNYYHLLIFIIKSCLLISISKKYSDLKDSKNFLRTLYVHMHVIQIVLFLFRNMENNDDDDLSLSSGTLLALNEFLQEQEQRQKDGHLFENWQLSQFWYTDETSRLIVEECISTLNKSGRIACLCCPSVVQHFMDTKMESIQVSLFEYDRRFEQKFPQIFAYYDYREPLDLPDHFHHQFDFLIADPPFLSDECMIKVAQTIRLLSKKETKLMLNTGAVMEGLLQRILDVRRTEFRPAHKNNLANEFMSFSNYIFSIL